MLRSRNIEIEEKPRKRVKLDLVANQQYDEFKGQAVQIEDGQPKTYSKDDRMEKIDIKDELSGYSKILQIIKKNPRQFRKMQQALQKPQKVQNQKIEVKLQQQTIKKQAQSKAKKDTKNVKSKEKDKKISSNWKQFLEKQKKSSNKKNNDKTEGTNNHYQFVAIDCEFVKSGEFDCLARISLVNEHGDQLYDSYVKPSKKITDFVTDVSGITYGHIKNAPNEDHVIPQIKRKMLNKIVIGHTVAKDLQICGLKDWKGFKKVIDIADCHPYSPGGKRVALKKLAFNYLGKVIQQGWHSSIQDARATMQLFAKRKHDILKQKNVVKK